MSGIRGGESGSFKLALPPPFSPVILCSSAPPAAAAAAAAKEEEEGRRRTDLSRSRENLPRNGREIYGAAERARDEIIKIYILDSTRARTV